MQWLSVLLIDRFCLPRSMHTATLIGDSQVFLNLHTDLDRCSTDCYLSQFCLIIFYRVLQILVYGGNNHAQPSMAEPCILNCGVSTIHKSLPAPPTLPIIAASTAIPESISPPTNDSAVPATYIGDSVSSGSIINDQGTMLPPTNQGITRPITQSSQAAASMQISSVQAVQNQPPIVQPVNQVNQIYNSNNFQNRRSATPDILDYFKRLYQIN